VALTKRAPRKQRHSSNRLNVELFGMLANRQTEAQQKRVEARPGETTPHKQDKQEVKPETAQKETAHTQAHAVQSENLPDMPDAVRLPELPASLAAVSRSSGMQAHAGGDSQQRQQFTGRRPDAVDVLNAYLAQLAKRLRANLVYPPEAKKKKLEGFPQISFVVTESGEIKPNTLTVKKSSGYALLDASALKTAMASAPFQKPPRELGVSITIAFEIDR
jgi:protein TonB